MTAHVMVITQSQPYPTDPRVRAEVESMIAAGYTVTVIAPTGYHPEPWHETIGGVDVHRYAVVRSSGGLIGYVREYAGAVVRLSRLIRQVERRRPADFVFVCSPPDFLVLLALPLARRGAAIVFDDRELSPELFEVKFGRRWPFHPLLVRAERFAFRHSDAILVTNSSYVDNVCVRAGVEPERVFVVGNGPDPRRVFPVGPRPELRRGHDHLVLWLGAMSQQDGVHHLVDVADEMVNQRGRADVAFALVGPGDARQPLMAEVHRRGLAAAVDLPGPVDDDLVRAYLSTADVCVGVDECNTMNDRAEMRKVLEYMAMGRAVVQFPVAEMCRVCGDATVYARNADAADMADRIEELLDDPQLRAAVGVRGRRRLQERRMLWPDQAPSLLAALDAADDRRRQRQRQ